VTKLVEFFFLFFQETSHQQKEQCRQVHRTVDRQEKTNPSEVTELSSDRILRLETVGDAGDVIDRELEKGTRLPYAVRQYFFGFSVSKNYSDIEEKIFKVLYAVGHTSENILSLICSGSHLICSRSHLEKYSKSYM
jgi:hypothetical protein